MGGSWTQWLECAMAFGVYMFCILLGQEFLYAFVRLLPKRSKVFSRAAPICTWVASLVLWQGMALHIPSVDFVHTLRMHACLTGLSAGSIFIPRLLRLRQAPVNLILFLSLLSGVICIPLGAIIFFLNPDKPMLTRGLAVAWASLAALGGLGLWFLSTRAAFPLFSKTCFLLLWLALGPALLRAAPILLGAQGPGSAPSLIFITADAFRADYASTYGGHVPTPNLTRLAESGALFERCYALAPWTQPSLCGLFSSKYPPGFSAPFRKETGRRAALYHRMPQYWQDEFANGFIRRLSKGAGPTGPMRSLAVVANPVMDPHHWLLDQFDDVVILETIEVVQRGTFDLTPLLQETLAGPLPSIRKATTIDSTLSALQHTLAFMERYRSRPFFLWVHFMDPHGPYEPPKRFALPEDHISEEPDENGRPKRGGRIHAARYAGEIRYVDWALGEILDRYEKLGMDEHTYLCFSSDHGEEFLDHGGWEHCTSLYEELLHVPLAFSGPSILSQTISQPVSMIHILPTFARLLLATPSEEWQGCSLGPMLCKAEPHPPQAPCFAQANFPTQRNPDPKQMVVQGRLKLICNVLKDGEELYDLVHDPDEQHPIPPGQIESYPELKAELKAWAASFPALFVDHFDSDDSLTGDLQTEALMNDLYALGYVGGDSP